MPRSLVVSAGVFTSHMSVSLITATSAANASWLAAMKAPRLGLPTSSSPSISTVTRTGSEPVACCQARSASSHSMT